MDNTKRNFGGHAARKRFFKWAKEKMTGADAFEIMYGEKGREYPEEMKEEFAALFDEIKAAHAKLHGGRQAFMEKWKEYAPEERDFPHGGRFGGEEFRGMAESPRDMGEGPRGYYGRHGW